MNHARVNRRRGFTLIEILVVTAIFSLLASIVLVATNQARSKGTTAAGLQFEATLYHAKGAYAAGIWDFDGGDAKDTSGLNNNGTVSGGSFSPDTPSGRGQSFNTSASNPTGYIQIPANLIFDVGNPGGFTFSAWIKAASFPTGPSGATAVIMSIGSGQDYIGIYNNNGNCGGTGITQCLRLTFNNTDPVNSGVKNSLSKSTNFVTGIWYHVAAVYSICRNDPNSWCTNLYVNGKEEAQTIAIPFFASTGAKYDLVSNTSLAAYVGTKDPSNNKFDGLIDNARFYNHAASIVEIQKLYAEGAAEHLAQK